MVSVATTPAAVAAAAAAASAGVPERASRRTWRGGGGRRRSCACRRRRLGAVGFYEPPGASLTRRHAKCRRRGAAQNEVAGRCSQWRERVNAQGHVGGGGQAAAGAATGGEADHATAAAAPALPHARTVLIADTARRAGVTQNAYAALLRAPAGGRRVRPLPRTPALRWGRRRLGRRRRSYHRLTVNRPSRLVSASPPSPLAARLRGRRQRRWRRPPQPSRRRRSDPAGASTRHRPRPSLMRPRRRRAPPVARGGGR